MFFCMFWLLFLGLLCWPLISWTSDQEGHQPSSLCFSIYICFLIDLSPFHFSNCAIYAPMTPTFVISSLDLSLFGDQLK